ncbi:uncharacterized protein [Malus domestica]|uniref:uncharacterized protein n=1 Tax=Malus domestica TaxID=3750 RepID=UPI003975884C
MHQLRFISPSPASMKFFPFSLLMTMFMLPFYILIPKISFSLLVGLSHYQFIVIILIFRIFLYKLLGPNQSEAVVVLFTGDSCILDYFSFGFSAPIPTSWGEMELAIIGRCNHNGKTVAFPIFGNTSFAEVCSHVCSRFDELVVGTFDLTYAAPGHPSCLIQSNMDVRLMHLFFINEKKTSIDINISDHMIVEAGAYANAENSFVAEGNIPADDREFLGKFSAPSGRMHLSHPLRSYISNVGQKFVGGVAEFRDKLKKYAVEVGFKFSYVKNDKERVTATCTKKLDGCPWRVYASVCRTNGYFYIRRLNNNHTCSGRIRERRSKMMNSSIVSSIVADQIRSNPLIKPTDIVKNFKQNYGLDISYYNAWYGRMKAKALVHGAEAVSYQQLTWYVKSIKEHNPGSHCILECEPNSHRFKRLFISYYSCIEGFRFCRPLLFLDGTFVKNNYKGTLLAATGKNGNQGFFPLAFAMVDHENEENWTWFMEQLSYMLTPQERTITFVSDRNKGLLESVTTVFPHSHHAFCLEHLKRKSSVNILLVVAKFSETILCICFASVLMHLPQKHLICT